MLNTATEPSRRVSWLPRGLLLLLILLAFARLMWGLGGKNLGLDESYSLVRAESDPRTLLWAFPVDDGIQSVNVVDQHPFVYFALLRLALRLFGTSEFALRFLSAMTATLLVPVVWAFGRLMVRRGSMPGSAPWWAALLAAVSPFYLWYGQEVRMYVLVALLALADTYLLLRWAEVADIGLQRRYLAGYLVMLVALLGSHLFAWLILPLHAAIVYQRQASANRRKAVLAALGILAFALLPAIFGVWQLIVQPGAVSSFSSITLSVLIPDLVNAFSLGISVDIARVWPLNLLSAILAVLGMIWALRTRSAARNGGWVLVAAVTVPPLLLVVINLVRPAYMTARHMSLISGFFLLLVGSGIGWLWQLRRWAGALVVTVVLAGTAYSTINYYTAPQYAKGDFAAMGDYLRSVLQPGDLLLLEPPSYHRLFRYYLPVDKIEHSNQAGTATDWLGVPMIDATLDETVQELEARLAQSQRVWLARAVGGGEIERWLKEHTFPLQEVSFTDPDTELHLQLFLPRAPVFDHPPETIAHPLDASFGGKVRLLGYDVGQPIAPGYALPVTLYWQPQALLTKHYKYILRLVTEGDDGQVRALATTEREPYDTAFSTTSWPVSSTVVEHTEVGTTSGLPTHRSLTLQMYDADTLEKLPVTTVDGIQIGPDGETLIMPF